MKKLIRITTVPDSLKILLKNQLKFFNSYFEVIAVSSGGKKLKDVEKDEGVKTYSIEMTRKITPLKDLIAIIKMTILFLMEKPYIVHSHTPKAGFVSMTAAWFARVPNRIHTVAGLPLMEAKGIRKKVLILIEKIIYYTATKVLPNSFRLKDYILKNGFTNKNKINVIGHGSTNGINLDYFSKNEDIIKKASLLRTKLNIEENDCIFLYIGRIVKDKGVNELISAFNMLVKKYEKTKLVLVGNFEDDLNTISNNSKNILNNNKNIRVCGFQNDIRPYFSMCDVFVFPSYREGFPNVVLQACSFEIPCIVTDINGSNEIIKNNINGKIIKKKSINELFDAMHSLLKSEQSRKELTKVSRKIVEQKFKQKFVWDELLKFYKGL